MAATTSTARPLSLGSGANMALRSANTAMGAMAPYLVRISAARYLSLLSRLPSRILTSSGMMPGMVGHSLPMVLSA